MDAGAIVQFRVDEVLPSYWRVTFENGPVNVLDVDSIAAARWRRHRGSRSRTSVTVVVFDEREPRLLHGALGSAGRAGPRLAALAPGPTGQHPYVDNLIRLSKVPAVTISAIRGRVRGAGGEFVLATDIRFAGDRAVVGHFDVGVGSVPGAAR